MILSTAQQMKALDRRTIETFGLPGMVLMENAARGVVQVILEHYPSARSLAVLCGKGNNGGDGLAVARYFRNRGHKVKVFLSGPKNELKGDAAAQLRLTENLDLPIEELNSKTDWDALKQGLAHYDLLLDALLGTGLEKEVTGIFLELIRIMNALSNPTIAIDIPSGLSSDTGEPLGLCTRAEITVTFALPKIGQFLFPGSRFVGKLFVVDIGIPPLFHPQPQDRVELLEAEKLAQFIPRRPPEGHKGSYGHVLVLAGSKGKTGAATLTCLGALRVGAGLVTLGIPESLNPIMEVKLTEAMTEPLAEGDPGCLGPEAFLRIQTLIQGKKALAIGPGLSLSPKTKSLLQILFKHITDLPLVVDADALTFLAESPENLKTLAGRAVLTPHPGEMSRLSGLSLEAVQKDRLGAARALAGKYQVVVVLKGARTIIADPRGPVYLNPVAHSILASGGTGDVLTGLILGLLSQGSSLIEAACLSVFL
ncbi:MAG: NAD(P)H-hydrate dehydratase, partial [Thermodesulfobacteriota bacterium]